MLRLFTMISLILASVSGCATLGSQQPASAPNPVFVSAASPEMAWERTVDAIHDFRFPITRESKLDGVIETGYVVGSSALEPWKHDSVGPANRWEDTLQSTRRRLRIRITPGQGGYLVAVEAFKEREDVRERTKNTTGGASFLTNQPLQRDLNVVGHDAPPEGWIPYGRDPALEQAVLERIKARF